MLDLARAVARAYLAVQCYQAALGHDEALEAATDELRAALDRLLWAGQLTQAQTQG